MNCPACTSALRPALLETAKDVDANVRMYKCTFCSHEWYTLECDMVIAHNLGLPNLEISNGDVRLVQ